MTRGIISALQEQTAQQADQEAQAAEARQEEAWQRAASLMEQASAVRPPRGRRVAAARVPRARRVVSMVALWPSRGPLVSRATTVQPQ